MLSLLSCILLHRVSGRLAAAPRNLFPLLTIFHDFFATFIQVSMFFYFIAFRLSGFLWREEVHLFRPSISFLVVPLVCLSGAWC